MLILADQAAKITFVSAGQFIAQESWVHPERVIDSIELIYVTQGPVYLEEEGSPALTARQGDLLLLQPRRRHRGTNPSPAGTAFYWVHFELSDPDLLGQSGPLLANGEGTALALLFRQLLNYANSPFYPAYARELALGLILAEVSQT
ncbi:MAG: AraC family ligand binding domain-containing protein, partial [Oscillospiraceae bacterium]|nr:AraC family ligand binding domain-containing protein [Oscillospiraceae bacterium]